VDPLEVALPGDFSNQDGGESFMTQFLDHAKEVDLAGLDLPATELMFGMELELRARTFAGRVVSLERQK
jgi:hypothetical protein